MPYLILTSSFPSDKSREVAERTLEAIKKYPPDESLGNTVIPIAAKATKQGVEAMRIMEIKEGKLEEALSGIKNEMAMFQSIVEFEHSIEVHSTAVEAMAIMGMSFPE